MIKEICRQAFTESDNKTHSIMKYLVFSGTLASLFYQGYDIIGNHTAFNMMTFGTGVGTMWAGAGVALGLGKEASTQKDE